MRTLRFPHIARLASVLAGAAASALAACAAPPLPLAAPATHSAAGQALSLQASPIAAPAPAPKAFKVRIANFVFADQTLTIPAGATVTWVNEDDIPHTVVSADHATFRSKVLDTDQSFSFTFTSPGEYPYFCSIHPHMTGKVVVTPS